MERHKTNRQCNYDLLRIVSMIAVIILHINAHYFAESSGTIHIIQSAINILTRFSVPCFVMLSGAFILSQPKNIDYFSFYKKVFCNTVFPFLIVALILTIISLSKAVFTHTNPMGVFYSLAIGDFFNLWYMYMLFGLYFFAPIIILIKRKISNRVYCVISFIWLAFAIWFQYSSDYSISYSFGVVFAYMGYFLVGNVIYENFRINRLSWLFFAIAMVLFSVTFIIRFINGENIYSVNPYKSFFSPTIVIASLGVFLGFSNISFNHSLGKLPKRSFYIYLFHTIVYQSVFMLLRNKVYGNELVMVLLVSTVTFVLSYFVSVAFEILLGLVDRRLGIKEKIMSIKRFI